MRLATAADEILPLRDPRVQQNPAYLDHHHAGARDREAREGADDRHRRSSKGCSHPISNICSASTRRSTSAEEPQGIAVPARPNGRAASGAARPGGSLMAYPVADLYEEMAFIAAHFHWSSETLMTMEHGERRRWCREISPHQPHAQRRGRRSLRGAVDGTLRPLCRLPLRGPRRPDPEGRLHQGSRAAARDAASRPSARAGSTITSTSS